MFIPRAVRRHSSSSLANPPVTREQVSRLISTLPSALPPSSLDDTAPGPQLSEGSITKSLWTPCCRSSDTTVASVDAASDPDKFLSSQRDLDPLPADLHRADEDEECPVKAKSVDQRAAEAGEPTCIICGRYGEYICDETDDDVCSQECKAVLLERTSDSHLPDLAAVHTVPKTTIYSRQSLPSMQDDFEIIVRDGEKSMPEWEPSGDITKLTAQQVDLLRKQMQISVQGDNVPRPILEFSNCKFPSNLQMNLEIAGWESPTPVQMQAIPVVLKGRDMLVSAGTGSGKSVGYLLSIVFRSCLIRSHFQLESGKPLAIVLTPTRELCIQVEEQAKSLAKGLPFKTALVIGGDTMPQQWYRINQGVELIVGTPGRLVDLLAKHDVQLDNVCMLVLDEVDCMLERGFRDQVMQIQMALSQPQILMFSATIPPSIEKFSISILRRPILISVGKSSVQNEAVKQTIIWVESNQKRKKLLEIFRSPRHFHPPVVVFVNSRVGAELLAESIQSMTGLQAAALHGDKPMPERRVILKSFLMGGLPIVVATGLLGRGLDLLRVTQVIVFDMPHNTEEYIHQIGRASRLGAPGSAIVFLNEESKVLFKDLLVLFQRSGVVVPKELSNSPYAASSYAAAYSAKKRKLHHRAKR